MNNFKVWLTIGLLSVSFAIQAKNDTPRMSETLTVSGAVKAETTFTLADLKKLAGIELQDVKVICQSGEKKGQMESLTGVPLKTLLENVGLNVTKHKDFRKLAIIAYATDDYWVTYSWGEIFNQIDSNQVVVYFAKDGVELGKSEGRFALMPANDARTGARQVKWLERIEVRMLTP